MLKMVTATKPILITATICVFFCLFYALAIQPFIFYLFGLNQQKPKPDFVESPASELHDGPGVLKQKTKRAGGLISVILPFYAFGIVVFFIYTIVKLMRDRNQPVSSKKDAHLKDYYRNFRYNPDKGKFQMDSDSSDSELKVKSTFDWTHAYSQTAINSGMSDIYRSVKGLPNDLEYLLKKVDEENLDSAEVSRLRARLEQMEEEMTELMEAINQSATLISNKNSPLHTPNNLHQYNHCHLDEVSQDDDSEEALFSVEED